MRILKTIILILFTAIVSIAGTVLVYKGTNGFTDFSPSNYIANLKGTNYFNEVYEKEIKLANSYITRIKEMAKAKSNEYEYARDCEDYIKELQKDEKMSVVEKMNELDEMNEELSRIYDALYKEKGLSKPEATTTSTETTSKTVDNKTTTTTTKEVK